MLDNNAFCVAAETESTLRGLLLVLHIRVKIFVGAPSIPFPLPRHTIFNALCWMSDERCKGKPGAKKLTQP